MLIISFYSISLSVRMSKLNYGTNKDYSTKTEKGCKD